MLLFLEKKGHQISMMSLPTYYEEVQKKQAETTILHNIVYTTLTHLGSHLKPHTIVSERKVVEKKYSEEEEEEEATTEKKDKDIILYSHNSEIV